MNLKTLLASAAAAALLAGCGASNEPAEPVETPPAQTTEAATQAEFASYSAEAFFQTTSYSLASGGGYVFSENGNKMLVSSDETGVFNAYALSKDGSRTPLTNSTTDAHFAITYFPFDDRILVTADKGGDEFNHIYVREDDGSLTDLTPGENVKASFGGFRDDQDVFYVWSTARTGSSYDLYEFEVETLESTLIFENPGFSPGAISNSGEWLALDKPRTSADSDVYLVNLYDDEPTPILVTEHDGNIAYGTYDFTPDESKLVLATNEYGEFNQAWTYDIETKEMAPLIEADWDVSFVTYSPSGKYRVSAVNNDGLTDLTILDTEAGSSVALPGIPEGELSQIRFSRDESEIAFRVNSDTSPANVYLAQIGGGDAARLTDALNPDIDEANLVTATVERFEASDGVTVPGIMYKPKLASADNPVPAVVWVHGGPGGQSQRGYSAAIQHLVNHGYAVYAANNRGSSGYGKTFFHMDDKRHGEEDLRDIVEAGDYLRGLDWVDGDKVGVMGGSYGGYMTAAALTFHPEAFEVGINIFGVTNWERTLSSIPAHWNDFKEALYDEMGDPATDAERHRRISPLFHAENIVKPMLVVQGARDVRVLQAESDDLVAAARENGATVEYIVFPNEGHGFRRRDNRITASDAYLNFLNTYLKGDKEAG